ncbi:hypothetical protein NKR23_g1136 [Pleurostoma richardsiae]|uniref:Uncharacterized protein n=1 Tax=Pleurostoma richardsiae TaxID=41990 RepID=A0AA38SBE9_9PEZI|nr:hypothetical protein NKR23_g1136 [Pleurostoma richardsiae]
MPRPSYKRENSNVQDWLDGQYEYIPPDREFAPDPPPATRYERPTKVGFYDTPENSDSSSMRAKRRTRSRQRPPTPPPSDFYEKPRQSRRHERDEAPRGRDLGRGFDRRPLRSPERDSAPPPARGFERYADRESDRDDRRPPPRYYETRHPPPAQSGRPRRPSLSTYSTAPPPTSSKRDRSADIPRHRRSHRDYSPSPSPPRRPYGERRTSLPPVGAASSSSSRRPRDSRQDGGPSTRPPITRSKTTKDKSKTWLSSPLVQNAAAAALQAGAMTALDSRREPGKWGGAKGARVATAALGAAAMDAFAKGQHKSRREATPPRHRGGGSGREELGTAIGDLLADRISRKESRRSRH